VGVRKARRAESQSLTTVLISTESDFSDEFRGVVEGLGLPVQFVLEIPTPFTAIGEGELKGLRDAAPTLAVVDLESDPQVGLRFIQYLLESGSVPLVIGVGRDLPPELILKAMQVGVSELLTQPLSVSQVEAAIQRVWKKTGRSMPEPGKPEEPGRVVALYGLKGGAGATAVATNLAVELHRQTGGSVLLLDLDLELGDVAHLLGMKSEFSLVDLARNLHRADAGLLASYVEEHESGIHVLAAPFQPTDLEAVSRDRLRQVIRFLKEQFDWVVMDTPGRFDPATLGGLEEADDIYIVVTPELSAVRNVVRSLPLLKQVLGPRRYADLRLVVNRFQPGGLISLKEIEETVGVQVAHSIRNDFEAVSGGINQGKPAVSLGASVFAKGIQAFAGVVTGAHAPEEPRKGKGLLSGLVGALKSGRS
jgi:pilus assembly protein CpaE